MENIDDLQEWNWDDLEDASVTVDYVSDGAPDDSEIRVDAVGIRVKYHQPWYYLRPLRRFMKLQDKVCPYSTLDLMMEKFLDC